MRTVIKDGMGGGVNGQFLKQRSAYIVNQQRIVISISANRVEIFGNKDLQIWKVYFLAREGFPTSKGNCMKYKVDGSSGGLS